MGTKKVAGAPVRRARSSKQTVEVNDVGCDPHKATLTVAVLDPRGGVLGTASFRVSPATAIAMETFVAGFGPVRRWGIEGATGLGRHTAMYLIRAGYDVRDVCPNRTAVEARKRRQGKEGDARLGPHRPRGPVRSRRSRGVQAGPGRRRPRRGRRAAGLVEQRPAEFGQGAPTRYERGGGLDLCAARRDP